MRTLSWFGILVATVLTLTPAAHAEYPDKTIRIVVPYPPGGFNDTLGRIVAKVPSGAIQIGRASCRERVCLVV